MVLTPVQVLQIEQLAWMQVSQSEEAVLLDPILTCRLVLNGMLRPVPLRHLLLSASTIQPTGSAPSMSHLEASGAFLRTCTVDELDHVSETAPTALASPCIITNEDSDALALEDCAHC